MGCLTVPVGCRAGIALGLEIEIPHLDIFLRLQRIEAVDLRLRCVIFFGGQFFLLLLRRFLDRLFLGRPTAVCGKN